MFNKWLLAAMSLALLAAASIASARQDQPATAPSSDAAPADAPKYPVAYGVPTVPQVTDILQHLRERLEAGTGYRIINSKTRQEITDLSKPDPDATLDSGPQRKFSPYSYPMGVVYSGMLFAADATGDKRFADFAAKRFQLFADKLPQLSSWPSDDLRRNPFRNMIKPGNLDACGAMGAAMIKARRAGVGPDLSNITNHFAEYISKQQFRLEDGTLARKNPFPQSLWLDDAYMSVPLLAQQGKLTGDTRYFDDAAKQIKQFYAHLFIPSKGLFTHAGNMANADNHPEYCWGRANGWFMVATVELLDLLPENHSDRAELIKILRAHAKGVASLQAGNGMWHQLLDRPDSYLETSCTAMFAYSMAKGANRGWLDASQYAPVAIAAWNGLTQHVSSDGRLDGVCIGTNYADDYIYYYHRPATDDVHGYGPVLLAGSEMIRLLKNDQLKISQARNGPVMVTPPK